MITFSRKQTPLKVLRNGKKIGEIRRTIHGHFALQIDGLYWNREHELTKKGGSGWLAFKTLTAAKARASREG